MKPLLTIIFAALFLMGCKSTDSLSKQETIAQITDKIESQNYRFVPTTALPTGGRSVNLSYSYSLRVSKDSVDSYLPYFGRAYVAPSPTDEGGIKFVSTDFGYTVTKKKKDMWEIEIKPNDNSKRYQLNLQIGDTGYATLSVRDNNRQSISFYGKIE
ncbi:DUF4251 domain-containing protein [Prevotella sp. 10(H)]|uniref:DUF4251 domain-containing protein n=1 Tax=Prevotella sp. 10(H) TaxID=1158294 RepID=UPI0004A7822D|nr:DUF4251 domain-containing protein [Prevotella sp. 10(H)]